MNLFSLLYTLNDPSFKDMGLCAPLSGMDDLTACSSIYAIDVLLMESGGRILLESGSGILLESIYPPSPDPPSGLWLLLTGAWADNGQWDDADTWRDA